MKTTPRHRWVGAGFALLLASCVSDHHSTTPVPMAATQADRSLTGRLDASINQYRQSIGRAPIPRNAKLDRLAHEHCVFMANNRGKFSLGSSNITHYGFEERAFYAKHELGIPSVAENVAGGRIQGDIPSQLFKAWVESSEHRYNLKQDWSETGIGVHVTDDGMVYATQIFGTKAMSRLEIRERFMQF